MSKMKLACISLLVVKKATNQFWTKTGLTQIQVKKKYVLIVVKGIPNIAEFVCYVDSSKRGT